MHRPIGRNEFRVRTLMSLDPIGHVQARRIFSGENRGARRRANGAGRIRLREFHSLRREFVEVWRLEYFAAETTEVSPTQIIGENENEIEFWFFSGGGESASEKR